MKYVVTVKTGDKSGAGTDSNVYLSVLGDKSKFESVQLDEKVTKSKQNLFERKSTDEFELDQVDVGKIQSIKIGHDGKKLGSSWFLESIRIVFPIGSYYWKVDKWLDKDEGTAYVELKSTQAVFEAAVVKQELAKKADNTKQPQLKYNITVKTGDKMGAGTDSNVYLTLIGDKSKTEPILLDSKVTKGKKNLYEKNSTDEFEVSAVDVGKIQSIKIGHDGAKMGSSWYLEFIKIVSPSQSFLWKVDKWLDKDEGTSYIELKSTQAVTDAKPEPVKDTKKAENQVKYQVTVKTGDKMSAGTDSNVYLSIFGDKSKAESILLDSKVSKSKKNLYEKNSTDEFEVSAVDVGKIQSIKIGHDGAKMGSSWYLEFIKIVSPAQTFMWKVDKWLDKDEGTSYIELKSTQAVTDAKPEPVKDTKKPANQVKYQVTVKTGDKLGAGTDSNVYLTLIGDKSKTEPILLDSKVAKGKKNLFEKSNSDEFELNDVDVGKIQSIKIGHDGKKVASSWYLDSVKIVSPNDTLIWKVDKWLDPDEGTGYVDLTAAQAGKQEQVANKQAKKPSESQVKYQVTIKTGDKTGAGTDSAVRLSIYGDKSQIESVQLDQSVAVNAKKKNLFEKNSLDEFQLNGDNIGTIDRIKIGHDGSKLAAAWYLESITVKTPNETKTWTVNRWLDKDDGTAYVELYSKEKPEKKELKQNLLVQGSQKDDDKPKEMNRKQYEPKVSNKPREDSIKIEFRRLKTSLDKEVQKLKFPQRKEHQPYVFNDLNPYYDVNHLEHLINSRDQLHPVGYYNRFTALSIVEPWVAYRMDHTYAPMSSRSVSLNRTNRSQVAAKNLTDRPNENEITGSTLAPNFPKLVIKKPKNLNGPFFFDDVVNIRKELKKNMTSTTRFEEDRNRTINDYYRMNLDQTAENDNMRKAYNAYLQNTPGSKKALLELLNQHHEEEKNKTNNDDDDDDEKIKKVDDKKEQPASSSPTNDNNNKVEVKVNQS